MYPANINQAMLKRANVQHEVNNINDRVTGLTNVVNGVDVVFRKNDLISGTVLSDILSGTNLAWLNTSTITAANVYEAPAPSSYIKNLRPSGMWKVRAVDANGNFIRDAYSPLESFVRSADGSIMFNPLQMQVQEPAQMNYGGNLPNAFMQLFNSDTLLPANISALLSNIASSEFLNTSSLYFIQNSDLISKNFGGHAQSFTLHFE